MTRILQLHQLAGGNGRFANQLQWFALGKWFCEQHDAILQTPQWIGESVFEIDDPPMSGAPNVLLSWPLSPEMHRWEGVATLNTAEYSFPPMYTDEDFRRYLKLQPKYQADCVSRSMGAAHLRQGDFHQAPDIWPIVSRETLAKGIEDNGFDLRTFTFITEESPHVNNAHPAKLSFLQDFLIMCAAPVLYVYPSSSFSMCAARFNRNSVWVPYDYTNGITLCKWRLRE